MLVPLARDERIPALTEGRVDIAAANLTATPERLAVVDFAAPLLRGVTEVPVTGAGIDRYIEWNFRKKHPDLFAPDLPVHEPRVLREFVQSSLEEVEGGTFYQKLDYLFLVRYRRWAR